MSASTQPLTQPRVYRPYISNSYYDIHLLCIFGICTFPSRQPCLAGGYFKLYFCCFLWKTCLSSALTSTTGGPMLSDRTIFVWRRYYRFLLVGFTSILSFVGFFTSRRYFFFFWEMHMVNIPVGYTKRSWSIMYTLDHWLVADNVERNQPGVSTILSILKIDFAHFGGNDLAGGLLNCVV